MELAVVGGDDDDEWRAEAWMVCLPQAESGTGSAVGRGTRLTGIWGTSSDIGDGVVCIFSGL